MADKATREMQAVLKINPKNAEAHNYIGYSYVEKEIRLDEAKLHLEVAKSLKPNNPYILDSWGWYLYKKNLTNKAIVTLEKAAELSKEKEAVILEHLAESYSKANLREKAMMTYRKAAQAATLQKQSPEVVEKLAAKAETLQQILIQQGRLRSASRLPASSK
jgi:Tfp pilus assembly protein PilF